MIRDARQTVLLPVSLGEELPARETIELVARVRGELGIAVDRVVVNAVAPDPFPPGAPDLDARLAALADSVAVPGAPAPSVLATCAAHLRGRHLLNARWSAEIAAETRLPLVQLPRLRDGARGPASLAALGEALVKEDG
jgi:hypothetical protein